MEVGGGGGGNGAPGNPIPCAAAATSDVGGTYTPYSDDGDIVTLPSITGSGAFPDVDGVDVSTCDNILLANQSDATANGIWHLNDADFPAVGWLLERVEVPGSTSYPTSATVLSGSQAGSWTTSDDTDIETGGETRWKPEGARNASFTPMVRAAAASTGNVAATYDNGAQSDGQGATLTKASAGAVPDQDGVTMAAGDVLLLRAQTDPKQNGLYIVETLGDGSTAFVLRRHHLQDLSEFVDGGMVYVEGGSTLAGFMYRQTTATPTLGTSSIVFAQMLPAVGPAQTIVGVRNDPEMALANLLTGLEDLGLIVDSTTPM